MKKFLYIIIFLLGAFPEDGRAQGEFTQLNWDELRIDSVLPVYSEVVPLESNYRNRHYSVRVRYAEWGALTPAETAVVERFADRVADSLRIETFVGVSRGRGTLDIAFVPIVRHGSRYEKLLSGKIEIVGTPNSSASRRREATTEFSSRWTGQSVLASGRWVKISVQTDGIYHLTNNLLTQMGFSKPANCRVYGYGGHMQPEALDADHDFDDLEEVSLWKVADGFLFYANGLTTHRNGRHVVNPYARAACYFVTEADTPVGDFPVEQSDATPAADVSTFPAYASIDPQEYAWFQGGRQLFENYDYASGNSRTYSLMLPSYPEASSQAKLTVNFSAANDAETQVTTSFNGTLAGTQTVGILSKYLSATGTEASFNVSVANLSNSIRCTTTSGRHARLNFFTLAYTGQLRIDGSVRVVAFDYRPTEEAEDLCLSYAAGQQPQVWRLAERGMKTAALKGAAVEGNTYKVTVADDGSQHRYVAFDAAAYSSYPQPTIEGEISNQNLHAHRNVEMVIITPSSGIFDEQAERLAAVHREVDGMSVGVVRANQIYNEFSSGTPDATAYRRYLKMLYDTADSDEHRPRYLLLFGDCAFDNRMLTSIWKNCSPEDFLLCYESENSFSDTQCYVMEDYFGLLDDGEGVRMLREKPDIGVGRFPVRSVAEAEVMLGKTIAFLRGEQTGSWKNVVCFLGDDGDNNEHLDYANKVATIVEQEHPEIEVRKIMWDAYEREVTASGNRYPQVQQVIARQMNEGAMMMNYTGHGATFCLSHEMVMRLEDFQGYSSPCMPLWFTAACDVMPMDTQKDNIGETAVLNPNGAAVAFIGTTRTVYAYKNLELNRYFCRALFGTDELGRTNRVGDALRIAKGQQAAGDGTYGENKLHYVLAGDPALTFGNILNRVVLDSINGTAVDELPEDFTVHAGGKVKFNGHIEDADGHALDAFKGTVAMRLYDSRSSITCRNNNNEKAGAFPYQAYDKILYNGTDSVRNGSFELVCPVPIDIHYSDAAGRLLSYAVSSDKLTEARGYSEDFLLGGTEPDLVIGNGPKINAYLNDENFEAGQTLNASPYFMAHLQDDNGINAAGNGIGHDLELIVDGDAAQTYVLNDYYVADFGDYTRGHLAFSIPRLAAGQHKLVFRAWNTLNVSSSAELSFNVDSALEPSILNLTTSANPARKQTQFFVDYNRRGCECTFTIEVFDFSGRLLWDHTEKGSSSSGHYVVPWDLTTGGGFPLGSGVYLYRVRLSCDDSKEVSKSQKLIINRRQ